jgi:hypothetical protein
MSGKTAGRKIFFSPRSRLFRVQFTFHQPMGWYLPSIAAGNRGRGNMKTYMLMMLMAAIVAMSHLSSDSSSRKKEP